MRYVGAKFCKFVAIMEKHLFIKDFYLENYIVSPKRSVFFLFKCVFPLLSSLLQREKERLKFVLEFCDI